MPVKRLVKVFVYQEAKAWIASLPSQYREELVNLCHQRNLNWLQAEKDKAAEEHRLQSLIIADWIEEHGGDRKWQLYLYYLEEHEREDDIGQDRVEQDGSC